VIGVGHTTTAQYREVCWNGCFDSRSSFPCYGVVVDSRLTMVDHVASVCIPFCRLRQIRPIRLQCGHCRRIPQRCWSRSRSVSTSLHYCSVAVLYCITYRTGRRDHITPVLIERKALAACLTQSRIEARSSKSSCTARRQSTPIRLPPAL